jgi:hypothetical protein
MQWKMRLRRLLFATMISIECFLSNIVDQVVGWNSSPLPGQAECRPGPHFLSPTKEAHEYVQ